MLYWTCVEVFAQCFLVKATVTLQNMERYVFDRHFQFKYDYANNHIIKDNEISYSEL